MQVLYLLVSRSVVTPPVWHLLKIVLKILKLCPILFIHALFLFLCDGLLQLQTLTFPSTYAVSSDMLNFALFHSTLLIESWTKTSIYFCSHKLLSASISASLIDLFCALQFLAVQNSIPLPKCTGVSRTERHVEIKNYQRFYCYSLQHEQYFCFVQHSPL